MKILNFFAMLVCLLTLSLGFVACSDDNESGDSNHLVGTWEETRHEGYYYSNGIRVEYDEPSEGSRITFYEDGTGIYEGKNWNQNWNWNLFNNLLTLTDKDSGGSDVYTVASLTSTELVLEFVDLDDFERTYYRRVN